MMNGWILYAGAAVAELQRAVEEAAASGVQITVIHPKVVDVWLDMACAEVFVHGVPVPLPQFAIAGFVEESDDYNLALLQNLETLGVLCVNTADTLRNTGDKLRTHQLLAAAGIPCPRTLLIRPGMRADEVIRHLEPPLVVKVLCGSKGSGVALVKTAAELDNLLQIAGAGGLQDALLAQEYIDQSYGRDVRVLVVDRRPLVAMLRASHDPRQFKSNIAQGGQATSYPLTDELCALAQQVIDRLNLNIGGIDLLFKDGGFLVCEANSIPGFQGIESCQDVNVPQEIFKSLVRQLARKKAVPIQTHALLRAEIGGATLCEKLAQSTDLEIGGRFLGLCDYPAETQERVLLDIVRQNAECRFGRQHAFGEIRSVADFRARVPLSAWADYAAQIERLQHGESDLLFTGQTRHFALTSGTSGQEKLIPESAAGVLGNATTTRLRTTLIAALAPSIMQGRFLPLSNSAHLGVTAAGIQYGSASGLALATTPEAVRKRLAFPQDIYRIQDQATFDEVLLVFALGEDVRAIVANNAGRAEQLFNLAQQQAERLISDVERGELSVALDAETRRLLQEQLRPNPARAAFLRNLVATGHFTPRYYWPELAVFSCWLAGSVGRFAQSIRPWLPDSCRLFDWGYGASEGKFNVPIRPEQAAAPLALYGPFFEFLPLDGGEPLLAHELCDQTTYELVVTTGSGLYRYAIHDTVRVEGFTGKTPNIRFEMKSGDVANVAGEHLAGTVVTQAFEALPVAWKSAIRHYGLWPSEELRCYQLCVEMAGAERPPIERLQEAFERELVTGAVVYRTFRGQHLINPCQVIPMRPGWQARLYEKSAPPGRSSAQVKLPVILREAPDPDMISPL